MIRPAWSLTVLGQFPSSEWVIHYRVGYMYIQWNHIAMITIGPQKLGYFHEVAGCIIGTFNYDNDRGFGSDRMG